MEEVIYELEEEEEEKKVKSLQPYVEEKKNQANLWKEREIHNASVIP